MKTIAVGLSGGVDSAATAFSLLQSGYHVIGVTMKLFEHQDKDIAVAKKIALALGIPHVVMDYQKDFEALVIRPFIQAYESGLTPNPCVFCNRALKYGKLISDSLALGADGFATGHYVRIHFNPQTKEYEVLKAVHERKDQSYHFFHLDQRVLSRLIMPIGMMPSKDAVRKHISGVSFEAAAKKDSMGICFIPQGNHALYLKQHKSSAMQAGLFVDKNHKRLGTHLGIAGYTIGQKRRLGPDLSGKYVVTKICPKTNTISLGNEQDLLTHKISLNAFHFTQASDKIKPKIPVQVKLSQWSQTYEGILLKTPSGYTLTFHSPVRALAPGQAIVCYDGDRLVGGQIYR